MDGSRRPREPLAVRPDGTCAKGLRDYTPFFGNLSAIWLCDFSFVLSLQWEEHFRTSLVVIDAQAGWKEEGSCSSVCYDLPAATNPGRWPRKLETSFAASVEPRARTSFKIRKACVGRKLEPRHGDDSGQISLLSPTPPWWQPILNLYQSHVQLGQVFQRMRPFDPALRILRVLTQ